MTDGLIDVNGIPYFYIPNVYSYIYLPITEWTASIKNNNVLYLHTFNRCRVLKTYFRIKYYDIHTVIKIGVKHFFNVKWLCFFFQIIFQKPILMKLRQQHKYEISLKHSLYLCITCYWALWLILLTPTNLFSECWKKIWNILDDIK